MIANFITLPDDAKILILGLITSLLTASFAFLLNRWGLDLRGYIIGLSATLAAIVVTVFEFLLKLLVFVPDDILLTIIHLIVLAVSGYGAALALNRMRTPGYRSLR